MTIKTFILGVYQSNCYLISSNKKAMIIDPGTSDLRIIEYLNDHNLDLELVYVTHGHFDHTGGVNFLKKHFPAAIIYAPKKDSKWYHDTTLNQLGFVVNIDVFVVEGNNINFSDNIFTVYSTPGHSQGSTMLVTSDIAFVGDTIFFEGVGRTDLYGGNQNSLINSINKIYDLLPPKMILYPGHGIYTTTAHEQKYNPFVRRLITK